MILIPSEHRCHHIAQAALQTISPSKGMQSNVAMGNYDEGMAFSIA